jgi:hypothetical protein
LAFETTAEKLIEELKMRFVQEESIEKLMAELEGKKQKDGMTLKCFDLELLDLKRRIDRVVTSKEV